MGRSEKKVKSERINALKKKYDAYLEEDKKRKERNEYILEKLDKMRCCTALVQVRHKTSLIEDHRKPAPYNLSNQTLESLSYQPIPSSNQTYFPPESPQVMDESILQEISKKYILIPKSRPVHNNNYLLKMKSEKDESNDWKSKYDILEQLKKSEKEETVFIPQPTSMLETGKNTEKDHIKQRKPTEDYEPQSQSYHHDNNYNDIIPHKEDLDQDVDIHETNNQEIVYQYDNFNDIVNDETKLKENFSTTDNISSPKEDIDSTKASEYIEPNAFNPVPDNENNVIQYEYAPDDISIVQEQYIKEEITNEPVDNEQYFPLNIENGNVFQTIHPNDFVKEINNDMAHENIADTGEQLDYPVEIINAQDFTPHDDDVHVEDGVNINPEQPFMQAGGDSSSFNTDQIAFANNDKEKSDNNFDPIVVTDDTDLAETAGVETYAENVDNYYDEQTNENYTYNEDNVVDDYNAEYPAHNQNYNQEEYIAHYEGAQTEQPYTIEANENDAALQQYDQNYQQQYSTDYNPQDYQQGYEQQYAEQGYEQNEYIGQQQVVEENSQQETVQYEIQGETPQDVEQVLDNEEGYIVEKQNEPIEISGVEKELNRQPSPKETDQQVNKAQ